MVCAKYVCGVSGSNLRSNRVAQDGATRQSATPLSPIECSYAKEYREKLDLVGHHRTTNLVNCDTCILYTHNLLDLFAWIEIDPDQMHLPGIVCCGKGLS